MSCHILSCITQSHYDTFWDALERIGSTLLQMMQKIIYYKLMLKRVQCSTVIIMCHQSNYVMHVCVNVYVDLYDKYLSFRIYSCILYFMTNAAKRIFRSGKIKFYCVVLYCIRKYSITYVDV